MTSPHTHDVATPATEAPRATTDPRRDTRSFWGRSARLGGGTGRLLLVSLVLGLLIALLIGAAAYGLATLREQPDARYPWIMGLIMAATSLPIGAGVAWFLLVDRTTVRGASSSSSLCGSRVIARASRGGSRTRWSAAPGGLGSPG